MRKRIAFLLSMVCCSGMAQSLPSTESQKDTVYNFLFIDARWQNQFAFWGRNYGLDLPFASANLTYYWHSNFWMSGSGFFFFDDNIPVQTGLSLGYSTALSEKSDWHISYSQFFVPDNGAQSSASTMGYLQTTFGLDWKILYSTIQVHALFNKNSDVFFTTHHSRYFQFNQLLWKKIKLSFEPKASVTFGTNHFDYAEGIVISPGGSVSVANQNDSDDRAGDKIKILNWDFLFPLKFEAGRVTIDASWRYTVPLNKSDSASSDALHQFMIGLNYFIPFQRVKG